MVQYHKTLTNHLQCHFCTKTYDLLEIREAIDKEKDRYHIKAGSDKVEKNKKCLDRQISTVHILYVSNRPQVGFQKGDRQRRAD